MRSSTLLSAAAALGFAAAAPAAPSSSASLNDLPKRDPPAATAPWVQIDEDGQPKTTHTPSATVLEDGSTSVSDAAPHDLTATVYTRTWYGEISTSTGDPPNPTQTGSSKKKNKSGAITRCFNKDGDNAPFCAPSRDSTLYTKGTYYVTWDPDFFNDTTVDMPKAMNRTLEIALRLDWYNTSSKEWSELDVLDSQKDRVPAEWGYFPFYVDSKFDKEWQRGSTNLTISLLSGWSNSKKTNQSEFALPIVIQKHFTPKEKDPEVPSGQTLYIALPAVFGSILLLVIGGCIWNRKTRRIQLGNVMGRNRKGYTGRSARRMFRRNDAGHKEDGIGLNVRPLGGGEYRDHVPARPRRSVDGDDYADDADALGSLAGTPVEDRFRDEDRQGPSNAFRDEISRQERQRQGL